MEVTRLAASGLHDCHPLLRLGARAGDLLFVVSARANSILLVHMFCMSVFLTACMYLVRAYDLVTPAFVPSPVS